MEKFFNSISKPARLIFIIFGYICTGLYAILTGVSFGGTFFAVVSSLVLFVVGVALLAGAPILTLFGRKDAAKVVYLLLLGYWLLSTTLNLFGAASGAFTNNVVSNIIIIISFTIAIGLTGMLVFAALDFFFKKSGIKFIAVLLFFVAVAALFVLFIFHLINLIQNDANWPSYLSILLTDVAYPVALFFGYLYFFGAPSKK